MSVQSDSPPGRVSGSWDSSPQHLCSSREVYRQNRSEIAERERKVDSSSFEIGDETQSLEAGIARRWIQEMIVPTFESYHTYQISCR
ncbi:unnamed protein product [Arabis nemorensis]|uniref:Uncharacterized protein n=1 Tax=Arabis nemorensis TaxID=586526 RepID=A0A565C4A4_9BRAS|nr:unnamed protein product [Arabis nemorensis]